MPEKFTGLLCLGFWGGVFFFLGGKGVGWLVVVDMFFCLFCFAFL